VSPGEPFGGGVFIADKSAWERSSHPAVLDEWAAAAVSGQIATCPVVMMEVLYSAPDVTVFEQVEVDLRSLRDIPITRSVTQAAIAAMRELARRRPGYHRVNPADALIGAAAQDAGLGVLHYDRHYDRLAEVLDFESRWIAPPGSLG